MPWVLVPIDRDLVPCEVEVTHTRELPGDALHEVVGACLPGGQGTYTSGHVHASREAAVAVRERARAVARDFVPDFSAPPPKADTPQYKASPVERLLASWFKRRE